MVAISETTPGPSIVGHADALHVVNELPADSANIGNLRIGADPDPVIDDTAQMLDELAIEVRADLRPIRLDRDLDLGVRCNGWTYPSDKTCRRIRARAEKSPAIHAISIYLTTFQPALTALTPITLA
jgi:hypothetical protein